MIYYLIREYMLEMYLMIRLKALELLEKKGKTKYWLYKQLGMSYQNFSNMVKTRQSRSDMKISKQCVCCWNVLQTICLKSPKTKKLPLII